MTRRGVYAALASLSLAIATATFSAAVFSDPTPRGFTSYAPIDQTEILGRPASLSWAADEGFLVAAIAFACLSVVLYVVAARASR